MRRWALLVLLTAISSCGGNGGHGGSAATPTSGTGTFSLVVGDMPLADIESLELTITRAELRGDAGIVELFSGSRRIDLLDYRDQDFLFAQSSQVPVGEYQKIRLYVEDLSIAPNPSGLPVVIPGNGKLDLNPRGTISIAPDEAITARLDFDVARSVHVVLTGSGRYIVRPVVFVTIEDRPLPIHDFAGVIVDRNVGENWIVVDVDGRVGELRVDFDADAVIYDDSVSTPAALDVLDIGDRVLIRGDLQPDSTIRALVAFEGDPLRLRGSLPAGTATSPFPFAIDNGQSLAGTVDTSFADGVSFFVEDGDGIAPAPLATGTRARFTGRYHTSDAEYRVGLVDLETASWSGTLASVDASATPPRLVLDHAGILHTFAWDEATLVQLIGDGDVPSEFLQAGLHVELAVSGELGGFPHVQEIRIGPVQFEGQVVAVDDAAREVVIEPIGGGAELTLEIHDGAEILRIESGVASAIALGDLVVGDAIEAYGLFAPSSLTPTIWGLIVDAM